MDIQIAKVTWRHPKLHIIRISNHLTGISNSLMVFCNQSKKFDYKNLEPHSDIQTQFNIHLQYMNNII